MPPKRRSDPVNHESPEEGTKKIQNYRQYLLTPLENPEVQTNYRPGTHEGILPIVVRKDPKNMCSRLHMHAVYLSQPKGGYFYAAAPLTIADYAIAAKAKVDAIGEKVQKTLHELSMAIGSRDEDSTKHHELIGQIKLAETQQTNGKELLDKANKELTELISVHILTDEDRTSPIDITACCRKLFAFWNSFLLANKEVEMAQANITSLGTKIDALFEDIVVTKQKHTDRHSYVETLCQQLLKEQEIQEKAENTFRHIRTLQSNQKTEEELASARNPKRPKTTNELVILQDGDPMLQKLENGMNTAAGDGGPSDAA